MVVILKIYRHLATVENALLVLCFAAMLGLASVQILSRNVWGLGISWIDPMVRALTLWVTMLGGLVATRESRHINIDIADQYLTGKKRIFALLISYSLSAGICTLAAFHTYRFVLDEARFGSIAFGYVPSWLVATILPLGFSLMAIRFVGHSVKTLRQFERRKA